MSTFRSRTTPASSGETTRRDWLTKSEVIARELRDGIVRGTLPPGSPLLIDRIASNFNCSATPVREAVSMLVAEGLVVAPPHRTASVVDFEIRKGSEEGLMIHAQLQWLAFFMAQTVELELVSTRLTKLEETHAAFCDAVERADLPALRTLNYDFHFALWAGDCCEALSRSIAGLWGLYPYDSFQIPGRARLSMEEHQAILDAFAGEEFDEVATLIVEHHRSTARSWMSELAHDDTWDVLAKTAGGSFRQIAGRTREESR